MMSISPSGQSAEGKGFEPSSREENRVSSAARPTVSGYLPKRLGKGGRDWGLGFSGKRGRERRQARCVRSSFPIPHSAIPTPMFPDGIEPSFPACRTGVVPLDHGTGMTEVGVEPTNSPGSRPGRFAMVCVLGLDRGTTISKMFV